MHLSKSFSRLLLLLSMLGMIGCGSIPEESTSDSRCPKHHIPLQQRTAYRISRHVMADPTREYIRLADAYPKHTPWFYSHKRTDIHKKREIVNYCPNCDTELRSAMRKMRAAANH
jgi:hypothetical protein